MLIIFTIFTDNSLDLILMISIRDRMRVFAYMLREKALVLSVVLLFILSVSVPQMIPLYPSFVDWHTLEIFAVLFLITGGLKDSGYLNLCASKMISRIESERSLALILIFLSFGLSMVITNDVTLLVIVPLTLHLQKYIYDLQNIRKMIIFEILAVNTGSALTPIGNPQNIYLWSLWGVGFIGFMVNLLPMVSIMLFILIFFAILIFPKKNMSKIEMTEHSQCDVILGAFSVLSLGALIMSMDLDINIFYVLIVCFIFYSLYRPKVIKDVDWGILLLLLLLFIDFNGISQIPVIRGFLQSQNYNPSNAFLLAALLSQFMSNVPAVVLLSNFTTDYKALVYGANVGGNGFILASLANLIAIRLVGDKKMLLDFHKYSFLYFMLTTVLIFFLLFTV